MEPPFRINRCFDYPQFGAITDPTGYRVYQTPNGDTVPSVTTILGTLPKPGIDAWKERVGEVEAKRVMKESTDIGSSMHDRLEGYVSAYLQGHPDTPPTTENDKMAYSMAMTIRRLGLPMLEEVWGIEEALYCHDLYAGRTDLIGVYEGLPSIIDYKSTIRPKPEAWIENYKLQISAYNLSHQEMFGKDVIRQGVILMAVRPSPNRTTPMQRFIIGYDELKSYEEKWIDIVEDFYQKQTS